MTDSLRFVHAMLVARTARRNEEGATAVEYGLMVALIAVAIIVTVGLLGDNLNTMFTGVKDNIPG